MEDPPHSIFAFSGTDVGFDRLSRGSGWVSNDFVGERTAQTPLTPQAAVSGVPVRCARGGMVLAIVFLDPLTYADPISLRALARLGARDELVLVCDHRMVGTGLLAVLRRTLRRYQLITLIVDGEVSRQERQLVLQILNEGAIPVICTTNTSTRSMANWLWLGADTTVSLPAEPAVA